jgi:hypothetical protein
MRVSYHHQYDCRNKGDERPFNLASHAALSPSRVVGIDLEFGAVGGIIGT